MKEIDIKKILNNNKSEGVKEELNDEEKELQRQYEIFKRIRMESMNEH